MHLIYNNLITKYQNLKFQKLIIQNLKSDK